MIRQLVSCLALLALPLLAQGQAEPAWAPRLEARLAALEAGFEGELGVAIRPLDATQRFGWRADESWYLASLVKVPVAIELMARVESGALSLDDRLVLREEDYVDGAGPTNWAPPGTALSLGELLEAMLTVSDNTASDMLIRLLGVEAVNRRAEALLAPRGGLGPITTLVDVRRHLYASLHPHAARLSGLDFIELQKRDGDAERLAWLVDRLDLSPADLRRESLDAAFDAYYASSLNAGRLDAFADLLATLAEGRALAPEPTAHLLALMARTVSGEYRLKAGLGSDIRFAHKTGTQRRRACDAGIAMPRGESSDPGVVIVACIRGEEEVARAERSLAAIGRAIREELLASPAPPGQGGEGQGVEPVSSQSRK